MVPDFVGMIGARLKTVEDPVVASGIAHHHEVDAAFHGAPLFLSLMGDAQDYLESRELDHGPAMAVAHVGVELILDGWLATNGHNHDAFCRALESAPQTAFEWEHDDHARRWKLLRQRLGDGTLPLAYLEPEFIASRLELILSARPRLALRKEDTAIVETWATEARAQIHNEAASLVEQVLSRLDAARS